jgi:hypothetical protein
MLGGYGSYGHGVKASLYIGRTAGISSRRFREGTQIPTERVLASVVGRRATQVGSANVGLSSFDVKGIYKGAREPSMRIDLVYTGDEPTPAAFFRNSRRLAQQVAGDLAQREVIVEQHSPRRKGHGTIRTASPVGAPSPLRQDAFCRWVRTVSESARTNPSDACYPKRKGR